MAMKILLIGNHPQDDTDSRSMALFANLLERELKLRNHDVRLLRPPARLWRPGFVGSWRGKWAKYVDQFLLFGAELRRAEAWADVVHVCDHSNAPLMSHLAGKPWVATCHDVIGLMRARGGYREERAGLPGRLLQGWTARNLRRATRIACVSRTVEQQLAGLLELPEGQTCTIYNGLNHPYRPAEPAVADTVLAALGVPPKQPLVLHVGSDEWKKNRRQVAEIFVELKRRGRAGHLAFAGTPAGPEIMDYLERQGCSHAVTNCGQLAAPQLEALYTRADLFLFPSLYEGFGWPIIEAQACGALVVTANRDPMAEVAGGGALLIDPENTAEAVERITRLTDSQRAELRSLGTENARRFDPAAMLEAYESLYRSLLQPPVPARHRAALRHDKASARTLEHGRPVNPLEMEGRNGGALPEPRTEPNRKTHGSGSHLHPALPLITTGSAEPAAATCAAASTPQE